MCVSYDHIPNTLGLTPLQTEWHWCWSSRNCTTYNHCWYHISPRSWEISNALFCILFWIAYGSQVSLLFYFQAHLLTYDRLALLFPALCLKSLAGEASGGSIRVYWGSHWFAAFFSSQRPSLIVFLLRNISQCCHLLRRAADLLNILKSYRVYKKRCKYPAMQIQRELLLYKKSLRSTHKTTLPQLSLTKIPSLDVDLPPRHNGDPYSHILDLCFKNFGFHGNSPYIQSLILPRS